MRTGSRGPNVVELQEALGVNPDGIFGSKTRKAVMQFQKANGLVVDGIAGRLTLAALLPPSMQVAGSMAAFLDTIAHAEGTDRYGNNKGYNVIVGGSLMTGYDDHPRKLVPIPAYGISSSAAGRYQILQRYWDHYRALLNLPDFSPESQDAVAIQMIKEQGAYNDVLNGNIESAISKVSNIWASFPGAGYGQREVAMGELIDFYKGRL